MSSLVDKFFNSINDKKVAFIGIGVSHKKVIDMFLRKGIDVTVCDKSKKEDLAEVYDDYSARGVKFVLGETYLDTLSGFDIIIRTPGMRFFDEKLEKAKQNGVVVASEMELFFELCPCKIFAITGSDGKTTTTTLISEMLKEQGKTVHLGGNIGKALLPIVEEINDDDLAVVELSSFQLISMRKSPDIAVVTNLSPNHLDMHKNMEEYIDSKKNLLLHQNAFSRTVLNFSNEITKGFSELVRGNLVYFSRTQKISKGTMIDDDGDLCYVENGDIIKLFSSRDIRIPGVHNVENFLAAIAAVWGYVSVDVMAKIAREFGGVEHRIEFVKEIDGVKYYNDSIATSPNRTRAGLNSFQQKIILIAGGSDKKIPFDDIVDLLLEKVKTIVLTGKTAEKIEQAIRANKNFENSELNIYRCKDLEESVKKAQENAVKGDIVSLSPMCASFDSYRNFEARGKHFKDIVNQL